MHGAADHKLWHSSVPLGEVALRVLALQAFSAPPTVDAGPRGYGTCLEVGEAGRWGDRLSAGGCLQCGQEESGLPSPPLGEL